VSYYETCKAQCDQLGSCSFEYNGDCAGYATDNCFILVSLIPYNISTQLYVFVICYVVCYYLNYLYILRICSFLIDFL
jgi:hypothetical protein